MANGSNWGWVWKLARSILLWMLISNGFKYLTGTLNTTIQEHAVPEKQEFDELPKPKYTGPDKIPPAVPEHSKLNLRVFFSERPQISPKEDLDDLVWHLKEIRHNSDASNEKFIQFDYTPSPSLVANGTLWAHIYLSSSRGTLYKRKSLVSYHPKPVTRTQKNLVTGEIENITFVPRISSGKPWSSFTLGEEKEKSIEIIDETPIEIVSFFQPNLTLANIAEYGTLSWSSLPPQMQSGISFHKKSGRYLPILYVNDFWMLNEKLIQMNETVKSVPIRIEYGSMAKWKWQFYVAIDQSFSMQENMGLSDVSMVDEVKKIFLESNPIYLGLTMLVSVLHSVFEFLTMKSDVQFWNSNRSMTGLSLQSIFVGLVSQIIIFLYLLDEETSLMIILPAGIGILVECWKITKAANVTVSGTLYGFIPRISIKEKDEYISSGTGKYDKKAMKYMGYVLVPGVIGYGIYTLIYESHKSWYSWVIKSATSLVYMLGFIQMVPQVWINYELKSVTHMPWKVMTYRFLTTIIDDLWAFLMTMPTLHRVACFRDDIIFVILLYQRWIYKDRRVIEKVDDSYIDDKKTAKKTVDKKSVKTTDDQKSANSNDKTTSNSDDIKTLSPDTNSLEQPSSAYSVSLESKVAEKS